MAFNRGFANHLVLITCFVSKGNISGMHSYYLSQLVHVIIRRCSIGGSDIVERK